jgi:hypothetical protein
MWVRGKKLQLHEVEPLWKRGRADSGMRFLQPREGALHTFSKLHLELRVEVS